ncbi:chromosomal replication initiator protein DnaA [bacterium]|nr:chromosomal replication initiator protein DnaA [bacterium]
MSDTEVSPALDLWSRALAAIQPRLSESSYSSWIESLIPDKFDAQTLWVIAPSKFHREFVEEQFEESIEDVLLQVSGERIRLRIREVKRKDPPPPLPQEELPNMPEPLAEAVAARPEPDYRAVNTNVNKHYRFDNFVEGDSNSFARAACLAVSNMNQVTLWNPLLIYGGTGLGKTHLLQAIGNQILSQHRASGVKVLYVSSEKFTHEFIQAVRTNRTADFMQKYRSMDLLLVDDIQFFAAKERTQIEFFHAFNSLYQNGKRIVLTSDRPVNELAGFDKRLISRFDSGLVTNINPPNYETRVAILLDRAARDGFPLAEDVADLLATHITSNVRELEGAYVTLVANCQIRSIPATIELARHIIQNKTGQRGGRPPVERIQETVAEYFKISLEALRGKSRKKEIVFARMIAMTLMCELTDHSLKTIGAFFGGRDHSTVIHARDTICNRKMKNDSDVINALMVLERKLSLTKMEH